MQVYRRDQIRKAVNAGQVIAAIEEGFLAYSRGEVIMPPVGHLQFEDPPGDVHIKYGRRKGDRFFVIKVASGFYHNPSLGMTSSDGLIMVFSAQTGVLQAILLDEGYLTDLRTAAAGAVAAKYLAPKNVRAIGIIGAGTQARMQLDLLRHVTPCRKAVIWARDAKKAAAVQMDDFEIEVASSTRELASACNLIVTTTPAQAPVLFSSDVQPGTHITAVGADAPGKQELEGAILARADVIAVDARSQCLIYGEAAGAMREKAVAKEKFLELGELIANPSSARTDDQQITVADLTGLAIQDIQIAKVALAGLTGDGRTH
jgi:ornithine cyclodeaminase